MINGVMKGRVEVRILSPGRGKDAPALLKGDSIEKKNPKKMNVKW